MHLLQALIQYYTQALHAVKKHYNLLVVIHQAHLKHYKTAENEYSKNVTMKLLNLPQIVRLYVVPMTRLHFKLLITGILAKTRIIYGNSKNKHERCFQVAWYSSFKWVILCTTQLKAFCFYCRFAAKRKLIVYSTKADKAFTIEGFCNWKKATEKFNLHEQSHAHREAALKYSSILNQLSIEKQLHLGVEHDQVERRKMFLIQLSSLRYLLRQGLAIRGHEEEEGNLSQLMKVRAEDNDGMKKWLKSSAYQSPEVINELICLMGQQVLRCVLKKVKECKWFAIIGDETRDLTNSEQLSISIRWVSSNYEIHEDPIGMIQVPKTDAETLSMAIKDVLIRCALPLSQCRGQAYDGASNMSGPHSGVAARITQEEPAALPVHCLAHCINLCLQDISRQSKPVRDALDLVFELVGLIKLSPKRDHLFTTLQRQNINSPHSPSLKPLCPTRWTCRTASISAVIENYETLLEALDEISETCKDEYGRKAVGFHALMAKFSTFFGLKLAHLVFSTSEQLSITLQNKDTTAQDANIAANLAKAFYVRQRDLAAFQSFYQNVITNADGKTEPPALPPRYSNIPRRYDDGSLQYRFSNPEEYYRQQYFQVMESLPGELTRRFDQKGFCLTSKIEAVILSSCIGQACPIPDEVSNLYSKDLNLERLQVQLSMLPDLVKSNTLYGHSLKSVTSIRTMCDIFNESLVIKNMFSEVHSLLQLYMTIPVTSATAERTFSVLRRMKTYLRSTMTQERLNNVMLLHIYKELTDETNLEEIAQSFSTANDRRMNFFGSNKWHQ